jgi:pilus assembly protein CpaF
MNADGKVEGYFTARGIRPKFADKLERMGFPFPMEMFNVTPRPQKNKE